MRRRLLLILLITAVFLAGKTQPLPEKDPQKLLLLIHGSKPDSAYISWLLQLSNYYLNNNASKNQGPDSALFYINQAEQTSLQLNYARGLGSSFLSHSRLLRSRGEKEKAKEYVAKTIAVLVKTHFYTDLGFAYWEMNDYYDLSPSQYPEKIKFIRQSVTAFHKDGNAKKEADALKELADIRQIKGEYVQAMADLTQSLKLYQLAGETTLQHVYDLMGDVSCSLGNLQEAVKYGLLAVQTAENLKDSSLSLCTIYNRLGITYHYLSDFNSSAIYYKKALGVAERLKSNTDIYLISYNYGNILIRLNKSAESIQFLKSVLNKYPNIDSIWRIHYTCNFVHNYTVLKQFDEAGYYFNKLTALIKGRDLSTETQRTVYLTAVRYLVASGQNEKARLYLKAEEEFLTKHSSVMQLAENQLNWTYLDSATGNYQSSFRHFRKYIQLKDSIFTRDKNKTIAQLNIQYETQKKDQDILLKEKNIELLEQKTKIQQSDLLRSKQTRNWILGFSLLLIVTVGLLINNARQKQQANKLLQAHQKVIESKNTDLQNLVKEKEWLVKEIHHRVKNNFHTVQGLLGTQSRYLKSEEAINALADSQHRVHAMSLIHQRLYQSDNLSAINMSEYVHELVSYLRDIFSTRQLIQFKLDIDPIELDLSHCIPLGLILNEAITNSIKYAFPDSSPGLITISFKRQLQDHLLLHIKDNGIGLPEGTGFTNPNSMGLKLMKGLSTDLDANISLTTESGTEICIDFIYNPESSEFYNTSTTEAIHSV